MKKNFLMMLALMLTTSLTMMADNDRVINFDDLIKAHVKATFPGAVITKIDRNRRGYEVKLSNGLEMEYNKAKVKGTDIKLYGYSTHKVKIRIGDKRYDGVELNII